LLEVLRIVPDLDSSDSPLRVEDRIQCHQVQTSFEVSLCLIGELVHETHNLLRVSIGVNFSLCNEIDGGFVICTLMWVGDRVDHLLRSQGSTHTKEMVVHTE